MKRPSFQFYPGDWLRDDVSACSLAAQGLWLRMMLVAHDSENYGFLEVGGSPMTDAMIARRCGCGVDEFRELLAELDAAGVPSRTGHGSIYSRRMVRDGAQRQQVSKKRSEAGTSGARSRWQTDGKCHGKPMANAMANDMAKNGSSSSSSSSTSDPTNQPTKEKPRNGRGPPEMLAGWLDGESGVSWKTVADRLTQYGVVRWRECIQAAQEAGCDDLHALALLDYATALGYGAGAVCDRMRVAAPGLPVDAGWPENTAKVGAAQRTDRYDTLTEKHRAIRDASAIVRRMRHENPGVTDEDIEAELAANGLPWPSYNE